MDSVNYFYNCSKPYVNSISPTLYEEIREAVSKLPKRPTQAEINKDLFWLLTTKNWSYDTAHAGVGNSPPEDLFAEKINLAEIKHRSNRYLCQTSANLDTKWHADFEKLYGGQVVQVEA